MHLYIYPKQCDDDNDDGDDHDAAADGDDDNDGGVHTRYVSLFSGMTLFWMIHFVDDPYYI